MEPEKQRGISISSTVLQFDYDGYRVNLLDTPGHEDFSEMEVVEVSLEGFQAECADMLPLDFSASVRVSLSHDEHALLQAVPVRRHAVGLRVLYGFHVQQADAAWRRCVTALHQGLVEQELLRAA